MILFSSEGPFTDQEVKLAEVQLVWHNPSLPNMQLPLMAMTVFLLREKEISLKDPNWLSSQGHLKGRGQLR